LNKNDESSLIKNLEEELKVKNELIDDVNNIIMQFNDEKNDIKAKFKHLM